MPGNQCSLGNELAKTKGKTDLNTPGREHSETQVKQSDRWNTSGQAVTGGRRGRLMQ